MHVRIEDERGFTMYAVMGAMLVVMMMTVAAFAAAGGDQKGARYDQDQKRTYSAAEAGVNEYLFHLNDDEAYWTKCDTVPSPAPVSQPWNGTSPSADPRKKRAIPGSDMQYAIELLPTINPATGTPFATCSTSNAETMIDKKTGTFRVRSTGFARKNKRSIIATFRRKGFLDFLYYTDLETANPVSYRVNTGGFASTSSDSLAEDAQTWASRACSQQYEGRKNAVYTGTVREGRNTRNVSFKCSEINFISGDNVRGPLHTNDQLLICGTPSFGRNSPDTGRDVIEVVNRTGTRNNTGCSGNNPTWVGEQKFGAPRLDAPPVVSLKSVVDPSYIFSGKTTIQLNGTTIKVNGVTMAYPPNGVVYIEDGAGTCPFYDPTNTDASYNRTAGTGCGEALVSGSYSSDLTIATEKDIVVTGNVTRSSGSNAMLGLIASNFIRVGHRVTNRTATWDSNNNKYDWSCDNVSGSWPTTIEAAMLAIDHSFLVDNWYCGSSLGNLTVTGAIAQKYRGTVGTFGNGNTGFIKDYSYDDRLRYRQPPHFLDPIQTGWRVVRQTEQTPAR